MEARPGSPSRIAGARRRVQRARLVLGTGGIVLFGATMLLARLGFAGHAKGGVTPLAPPQQLVQVVRDNQLQAGFLAPAVAPPGTESAPS